MIELITVISVMSVLAGLTVPAMKGVTGGTSLQSGVRTFAGMLSLARSEAIARHTVVRFAVAQDWTGKKDSNLRKISLWAWDATVEKYLQISAWEELPVGVVVEPELPEYVKDSSYATADTASVRGDCVLETAFAAKAEFDASTGAEPISARYIEFLPSGTARIPGGTARHAIFVTTQGFTNPDGQTLTYTSRAEVGKPANWAQVNVDTLTGRVRIYNP